MSNWNDVQFRIRKTPDRELFDHGVSFAKDSVLSVSHVAVHFSSGGPPIIVKPNKEIPDLELSEDPSVFVIQKLEVAMQHQVSLTLTRDPGDYLRDKAVLVLKMLNEAKPVPARHRQPAQAARQATNLAPDLVRKLVVATKRHFRAVDALQLIPTTETQLTEHYARREAELVRLQEISSQILTRFSERATELEKQYQEQYQARRSALETEASEAKRQLDEDLKKQRDELQTAYNAKDNELTEREKQLAERLKEADDKDNRFARRKIRQDLKKSLKERATKFELTEGTRRLRWVIHGFAGIMLLSFLTGAIITGNELLTVLSLPNLGDLVWLSVAFRQVLFTLAFSATAVFYLRWNNAWFDQHAQEEFRLKRLELDFDRASWVVEMALEWKEDRGTELPPELLDRLTAELFAAPENKPQSLHPADQLASALLGSSAEVELNLGNGGKVRLDRKGMSKLSNRGT